MNSFFKSLFIPIALILFLIPTKSVVASLYPLTAVVSATEITVTMTGVTDTVSEFELYDNAAPVPAPNSASPTFATDMRKKAVGGKVVWQISGGAYKNNYTYYLHAMKLPQAPTIGTISTNIGAPVNASDTAVAITGTGGTANFYTWPKEVTPSSDGQKAVISGKIDITKYPYINGLKVELLYTSQSGGFTGAALAIAHTTTNGSTEGVNDDGSYYWNLGGLTPNTLYYMRQTIKTGNTVLATKDDRFNSSTGYTPAGSVKEQTEFDAKSYHLLAPWPGLSVLMDPDLCAQQKLDKKVPQDAICDINGFLNFAFKTLIGLTAVVLVLRLMYEGYQYLVTDVPFLKASAKSGFFTALMGLLLALSAYLILNTINPKLVSNSINVASVEVGVEIVDYPDAGDDSKEADFKSGKVTYSKDASISPAVTNVVNKIKNEGWEISYFKIYTNNRMVIGLKKGSAVDTNNIIDVGHGINGFANPGQAQTGDKKTPIGTWKIIDIRTPKKPGQPVFNAQGSNMGAAFFHLSPMQNGERGIGMHGNKNGTLSGTNGCIRMKNADIEALLPYIKTGTQVVIGN